MSFDAFLAREFETRRRRNAHYSLRAFARDLGCDHSTLSQWLRGTRPITDDSIARISDALGLDADARAQCVEFDPFAQTVMEAAQTCDPPTVPAIAARLGVPADRVNVTLHRLLRLRLLRMEGAQWHAIEETRA